MKHRLPATVPYDLSVGGVSGATPAPAIDAYYYDMFEPIGSLAGATVLANADSYDTASATGSTSGGTVVSAGAASATGGVAGATLPTNSAGSAAGSVSSGTVLTTATSSATGSVDSGATQPSERVYD